MLFFQLESSGFSSRFSVGRRQVSDFLLV